MKTPFSTSSSWKCRVFRCVPPTFGVFAAAVQRHQSTCPGCRAHAASLASLDRELVAAARSQQRAPSDAFVEQLLATSRTVVREHRKPRRAVTTRWSLGVAAVLVVAILAARWAVPTPSADPVAPERPLPESPVAAVEAPAENPVLALVPIMGLRLPTAEAARLSEQNPLQRELAAVQTDTLAALRFLARNFLPNGEPEAARPPEDISSSS